MLNGLIFCLIAVLVLAVCIVFILLQYRQLRERCNMIQDSYSNLEQLNYELRAARHDYLNHLQVVHGLLELEEYEELKIYLAPVYKDMMKTGKALKTSKPALNALLMAKMEEAESQNIDFYVEVKSDLKALQIEDWQLCKLLSNLIDNAMTALTMKEGERRLEVDINESRECWIFSVSNNGPDIPIEMQKNIFRRGVTTKKGEGHGMGLAIVSDIARENNGEIELESEESKTIFRVSFGKGGDLRGSD